MQKIVVEAKVQITAQPVDPNESTQDRMERELYQARLDRWASEIARRIESQLTPISYEEAFIGAMVLGLSRQETVTPEARRAYEDAMAELRKRFGVR